MVTLYFTFQRSTIPRSRLIFTQQWLKMLTSHTWYLLSAVTTMPWIKIMNLSPVLRGAVDTATLPKRHLCRGTEPGLLEPPGITSTRKGRILPQNKSGRSVPHFCRPGYKGKHRPTQIQIVALPLYLIIIQCLHAPWGLETCLFELSIITLWAVRRIICIVH